LATFFDVLREMPVIQTDDGPRKQGPMRRVLDNFLLLARGKGVATVMTVGSTALMARSLGPAEFGIVVLIQSYALFIRGLLNFQLFEAVVRYGVPLHDANDTSSLQRLIAICQRIDRYASVIATVLALVLAPLIGPLMGMEHDHVVLLATYSLVLLTTGNFTSIGILRLLDQFDILGKQMAIGPVIRFIGVAFAWWFESPVSVFVAVLAFAYVVSNLYLSWCGRREFHQRIGHPSKGESISLASMAEFSGLRHFLQITYWQSNLDLVHKNLSIMLVGTMMGSSEAGLLRLARQFSSLLAKPAVLIRHVVFVDLTRSWNQDSADFKLVAYRTASYGGGIGMLFVLAGYFFGDVFLDVIVGKEFVAAAPLLTVLLLAATFDLAASSLRAAAYATGHAGEVLRINAVATVVYIVLFVLLVPQIGLMGAGVAACAAAAIPQIALAILIGKSTRIADV
jgi:O-antigen/teichoic acid export membrane protein